MEGAKFNEKYPHAMFAVFSNSPDLDINSNNHFFQRVYHTLLDDNEYIYVVKIPDDSQVDYIASSDYWPPNDKYTSSQLVINHAIHRNHFKITNDNYALDCVNWDPMLLKYVTYKTHEICLTAVKKNGWALEFVEEQTPELAQICMAAVQSFCPFSFISFGKCLQFVKNQTHEICLAAVKNEGSALEFVKEQTPELCLAAVQNDGWALEFVKEQTENICLAAVQNEGLALEFVKEQTENICLAVVKNEGWILEFVKEQTPGICLAAVRNYSWALEYVKEQTPEICLTAVQNDGIALKFVKEQTAEICLAAVQQNADAIEHVNEEFKYLF